MTIGEELSGALSWLGLSSSGRGGPEFQRTWDLDRGGVIGGYYFRQRHGLIKRHVETIELETDRAGRSTLAVELELPRQSEAIWSPEPDGRGRYLFPVAFLPKVAPRSINQVVDEDGALLPKLTRAESVEVTASAVATALGDLQTEPGRDQFDFTADFYLYLLELVRKEAILANIALTEIERSGVLEKPRWVEPKEWESFAEVLRILTQHTILWTPLVGDPGQRRTVRVSHDFEFDPKPIFLARIMPAEVEVELLEKRYQAPGYRSLLPWWSPSRAIERASESLAWMPIEMQHPTIFAKRCDSYHLQVRVPPGLRPRGLRPSIPTTADEREIDAQIIYSDRSVHAHVPEAPIDDDLAWRVTFGIGSGGLSGLWVLASSLTAVFIWIFGFLKPSLHASRLEMAGGILLVVPALLTAVVFAIQERTEVSRILSGARLLVLASALSAVGAAGVLIWAVPPGLETRKSAWVLYAAIATVATIPLAVSWLMSRRSTWEVLRMFSEPRHHYLAAASLFIAVELLLLALHDAGRHDNLWRALSAALLLAIAVGAASLANDRTAIVLSKTRGFAPWALMSTALAAVGGATYEIAKIAGAFKHNHHEIWGAWALAAAVILGVAGWALTKGWQASPCRRGVKQVSRAKAAALVAGETFYD